MSELPIPSQEDDRLLKQLLGHFDVPAYVRRARRVEEALDDLLAGCRAKRDEWLGMVCTRLGTLYALAGTWTALRPFLADDEQLDLLQGLYRLLEPKLRPPLEPVSSPRMLRRALRELRDSLKRFNRRWREFLAEIDLRPVNEVREGYNRYYVLEKECAVRSAIVARQGFRRLEPLTRTQLAALVPELPVPELTE